MTPGLSGIGSVIFRDKEFYLSQAKDPVEFSKQYIQPHKGELEKCDLVYKVFPSLPRLDKSVFKF